MPDIIEITDLQQPELDVYTRLTEAQLRCRLHPENSLFIAQSPKVIACALEGGCRPVSILAERKHLRLQADIIERCGDIPVYTADSSLLQQLTGFSLCRGILCAMHRPALPTPEQLCQSARRIAVLDGIVDATNIGAIIRSAAALNMDGVLVSTSCCDPLNRRAVRVSMGTVFQIPWTFVQADPAAAVQPWQQMLHTLGFKTAAMALREDSVSIDEPALCDEQKLAVVLGAEGYGLSRETISHCDYTVKIPMGHGVDSLNVAAAGAVAFWQLSK